MLRRPPRSTRTDTLFPYTTLFRSTRFRAAGGLVGRWDRDVGAQAVDDEGAEREPQTLLQLRRLGEGSEVDVGGELRSEEHTSELQSLMRISYAVFCLKKKNTCETYARRKKSDKHQTKHTPDK